MQESQKPKQPHISQFHSKPGKANQWRIMEWDKISSIGRKHICLLRCVFSKRQKREKKLKLGPTSQEPTIHQGAHLPTKPMRKIELKTNLATSQLSFLPWEESVTFPFHPSSTFCLWCFQLRFAYLKTGNVALTTPVSNVFLFTFRFWNQAGSINHASSRMKWETLRSTEISGKVERWSHPSYSSASCNNCTCLLGKTRRQ